MTNDHRNTATEQVAAIIALIHSRAQSPTEAEQTAFLFFVFGDGWPAVSSRD